ncbi:MAG TPA: MarR family transcriptional regulator [Solirubrobacteraceae bacterium]|jgi:DNA-binding MarR family transcriptional regulator|nr:MarR family transcriptional regulator [Solirubrobacteraceae bacterium]
MNSGDAVQESDRADCLDYVATHLVSRAALLVRLLVKQVPIGDISRTEAEVLGILSDGPRRITELAELEGLAQPTMTLLAKRLEGRGWVVRSGLPQDGRVVILSITEAGEAVFEGFRCQFRAALRADLEGLSHQQLRELLVATDTLGALVETLQGAGAG